MKLSAMSVALALLAACASAPLPYCENPRYQLAESDDGQPLAVFDMPSMALLVKTIIDLSKGACRLPVPDGKDV